MLKLFVLSLVGSAFVMGCSHSPTDHAAGEPLPEYSKRTPASDYERFTQLLFGRSNYMQDKYGDTKLIMCKEDRFIITHDPNYSGALKAQGKRGTDLPIFRSKGLEIESARPGFVMFGNRAERFELIIASADLFMMTVGSPGFGQRPTVVQLLKTTTPLPTADLRAYCSEPQ